MEWTTAALTQLAPAPSVAAVTMGKGAKGTARPSLVRRWEASVAAGQDGTGCAMAARAMDGAGVAGGALVAAIKAQWHETAAVELDAKTRVGAAPKDLQFLSGKWEMASDREQAGGENSKETSCRPTKKIQRKVSCRDASGSTRAYASVVVQYFRRKENVDAILGALRKTSEAAEAPVELMVNVDSGWDASEGWLKKATDWRGADGAPPSVRDPFIHIIAHKNKGVFTHIGSMKKTTQIYNPSDPSDPSDSSCPGSQSRPKLCALHARDVTVFNSRARVCSKCARSPPILRFGASLLQRRARTSRV